MEKFYYHFPPYSLIDNHNVPDYAYFRSELEETLPSFNRVLPRIKEKCVIVEQGDSIAVDEVKIDFIFTFHDGLYSNLMNDSSLVFKVTAPNKTVLFMGDLGPDGGDVLFRESRHLLKADILQMPHHGHMNCSMEVFAEILPEACLWCAPKWLWEEEEVPHYLSDAEKLRRMGRIRMYGTAVTRKWMDLLGVKTHYVTGYGTQKILL